MNTAVDGRSQAEEDAFHAHLNAANCLLYENDQGEERLNVGTPLTSGFRLELPEPARLHEKVPLTWDNRA
jgi:hypothetical protein